MSEHSLFGHWQNSVLSGGKTSFSFSELSNTYFKPTAQADTEAQIEQWAAKHGLMIQWRTETDAHGRIEDWVHFSKPKAGHAG